MVVGMMWSGCCDDFPPPLVVIVSRYSRHVDLVWLPDGGLDQFSDGTLLAAFVR